MGGFSSSLRLRLKYDPEVHLYRSRELKGRATAVVAENDGDRSPSPTRHYLFTELNVFVCNIMRASEEAVSFRQKEAVSRPENVCAIVVMRTVVLRCTILYFSKMFYSCNAFWFRGDG